MMPPVTRSFRERKSFASRKREVDDIRMKHPNKTPVIVERYKNEKNLPILDKTKFLVPEELTMGQLISIIRRRLTLRPDQSFFLLVNQKTVATLTSTMNEIYSGEKDEDGFVYMTYASQEMFGC